MINKLSYSVIYPKEPAINKILDMSSMEQFVAIENACILKKIKEDLENSRKDFRYGRKSK